MTSLPKSYNSARPVELHASVFKKRTRSFNMKVNKSLGVDFGKGANI